MSNTVESQKCISSNNNEICSICMEEVKFENRCIAYDCMHVNCYSCVIEWFSLKPTCPICQSYVLSIIYNIDGNGNYVEKNINDLFDFASSSDSTESEID